MSRNPRYDNYYHLHYYYLHFPDDFFPRGHCKFCLLLLAPEEEVIVWEGILAVHQEVHQVLRHLQRHSL